MRNLLLSIVVALVAAAAPAAAQVSTTASPCDDATYRQLLLSSGAVLRDQDRAYLAQMGYACSEYIRAFDTLWLYGASGGPAKDPDLAMALSVPLPGAGHIYAGEHAAGFGYLSVAALAPILGFAVSGCYDGDRECRPGFLWGGLAVAGLTWIAALVDAPMSVARANERRRRS